MAFFSFEAALFSPPIIAWQVFVGTTSSEKSKGVFVGSLLQSTFLPISNEFRKYCSLLPFKFEFESSTS